MQGRNFRNELAVGNRAGVLVQSHSQMNPIQVVIDTNVLVSAARSNKGASYALLARLDDRRFQINVSQTLMLEYEEKLKQVAKPKGHEAIELADRVLNYLLSISNRRSVNLSVMADGVPQDDWFIVDLAVASRSRFIVTYNRRHFMGVRKYGIQAIMPGDFIRFLEGVL